MTERARALPILALAAACGALLLAAPADVPFHPDIVRDLLIAKSCLADGCAALGSPSSAVFHHGFAWDHFLIGLQRLGLPVSRLPLVVGLLHAGGLILFFRTAAKEAGEWAALLATFVLGLLTTPGLYDGLRLLTLIPAVTCLLLHVLRRACDGGVRRPRAWFALCAVLFSLAGQWHLEMLLFAPGLALALLTLEKRAWAVAAFLVATFGLWPLLSAGSAAANWRLMREASWTAEAGGAVLLAFAALASLFFASRRGLRALPVFDRLLAAGAASYAVCLACVFAFHFYDRQYLTPLLPVLILTGARLGGPLLRRFEPSAALRWALPALLLAAAGRTVVARTPADAGAPPALGEIRRLAAELERRGYGPDDMYRLISSGQALQTSFQSGMWLYMPCLSAARTIGTAGAPLPRVLATAVPRGFPAPEGSSSLEGGARDILLTELDPWVDPARFTVIGAGPATRTLSFENPGHRASCLDGSLPYAARAAVRAGEGSTLTFPVRVPASGEARVLYLPGLAAQGQPMPGCAAAILEVRGVRARFEPRGSLAELRPTGAAQRGTITVAWPTGDPRCFAAGHVFYPMPMAEMPERLFLRLRPFLS